MAAGGNGSYIDISPQLAFFKTKLKSEVCASYQCQYKKLKLLVKIAIHLA
jgi:hypothetical protein